MLTVCWSPKGGSGASVVAAAVAVQSAAAGQATWLVDLDGDQRSILGVTAHDTDGLGDWLASPADVPADALSAMAEPVGERLRLLARGRAAKTKWSPSRLELAGCVFAASAEHVVVDAGSGAEVCRWWPPSATAIVVVRACYLALRCLQAIGLGADRLVLIEEPGRALSRRDVAEAVGDVALGVPWDPAVARAVDAGLLAQRMPRSLRALRGIVAGGGGTIQ